LSRLGLRIEAGSLEVRTVSSGALTARRDQARMRARRAGMQGASLKAKPARPGNR
jgi:hypothetical protein